MTLHTRAAITVILIASVIAACSSQPASTSAEPGPDSTTNVTASTPGSSATTAAPAFDPRGVGTVVGNAAPALPEGDDGTVSVIAHLVRDRAAIGATDVAVVVRYRTGGEIRGPEVEVTAVDPSGEVVATDTVDQMRPHRVPPGGVSFGFVTMENTRFPDGTTLEFSVAPTERPESEDHLIDLPITAFEMEDTSINVTIENDRDNHVGYAEVWAACFDETGALTLVDFGVGEPVTIEPGDTGTSTIGVGEAACPIYLLAAVAGGG